MSIDWEPISHITKIDPAEELPLDIECLRQTDLIIVGGSDGVTRENMHRTIQQVQEAAPDVTLLQEPYNLDHVSLEIAGLVDYISIPVVFNGDRAHYLEKHVDLFTEVCRRLEESPDSILPIEDTTGGQHADLVSEIASIVIGEGYVIQNVDSTAATVAGVGSPYSADQVAGAALATEALYGFPVFYLEYSGTYGGPDGVSAAAPYLDETALLYGGGIKRAAQTKEILDAGADAVVVGDCFHDAPDRYLQTIP
ncbi:heptaprenylglyceryl phosphate synthase [Saliphagus sp. LR7]|uniref:heptaprenylglyceryl phosphate synthase n=1 Tax=Saliphagus sp. LR7 TaxID=2282654 RepID=UPI000DF81828|nr:heptaprenylglyceryl phosphate synthase [Saliphagus sp. LR7]